MTRGFIVLGDKTSHGRTVIEASGHMLTGNVAVARVGDKVSCPKRGHGSNPISSGGVSLIIDGAAVASPRSIASRSATRSPHGRRRKTDCSPHNLIKST